MKRQVISELRKLVTARSAHSLAIALVAVVGVGTVAVITDGPPTAVGEPFERQALMNVVLAITPLFALLLGIRSFTDEFRFGSIVPTLLANPGRGQVLAAKVAATGIAGVGLAMAAMAGASAIGVPLLLAEGWVPAVSVGAMAQILGRLIVAMALWTTIGVGLGLAVRHQVAAIAGALIWMVAGEGIVAGFLPDLARYFPGAAGFSVVGINAGNLLAPAAGAMVLAGYAILATSVGGALMRRRDIV